LKLRLPPGYHAHHDPDVLSLRRSDSFVLALFNVCGFVAEEVQRAAWEDHGEATVGPSEWRQLGASIEAALIRAGEAAKERSDDEKREGEVAPYP
jgi:hypothetical protein